MNTKKNIGASSKNIFLTKNFMRDVDVLTQTKGSGSGVRENEEICNYLCEMKLMRKQKRKKNIFNVLLLFTFNTLIY